MSSMNMKKQLLSMAILYAILLSALCGPSALATDSGREKLVASDGTEYYAEGYPIVDPEQNVTYAIMASTSAANASKFPMIQKITEETGIHFEWILVSQDGSQERLSAMLASDTLSDILGPNVGFSDSDLMKYGADGYLMDVSDLWNNKMTTIRSQTGDTVFADITKQITFPNGAIYSFPTIMDYDIVSDFHIAINVEWLEALNLEMPKTPDEFVNVLKEFVTKDPNGNGKNDEIGFVSQMWSGISNLYEITGFTGVLTATRYIHRQASALLSGFLHVSRSAIPPGLPSASGASRRRLRRIRPAWRHNSQHFIRFVQVSAIQ